MIHGENGSKSYENFLGVTENVFCSLNMQKHRVFAPFHFKASQAKVTSYWHGINTHTHHQQTKCIICALTIVKNALVLTHTAH